MKAKNYSPLWMGFAALAMLLAVQSAGHAAQLLSGGNSSQPAPSGGDGSSVAPVASADGRFVLFSSSAHNLTPGDNNQLGVDVFLRDRLGNTTTLVSANQAGTGGGNGNSGYGQVSTNGRYVLFESEASDLAPNDTNIFGDIFIRDLLNGTNLLVSVSTNGGAANGASYDAVMTPDAHYVAFVSSANNLVAGDTNNIPDIYVRDLAGGTTRQITAGALAPVAGTAFMGAPVITPDGRHVAFFSTARGLAPGVPSSPVGEVYLCDLVANTTTWVSSNAATLVNTTLNLSNMPSFHPAISDDGRYVAFKTGWTNIYAAPDGYSSPGPVMIFRHDTITQSNTVVSTNGYPASTRATRVRSRR